jgi:hypothetical protein
MINFIKKILGLNYYTSPLDQFLAKISTENPGLSTSQHHEYDQYQRIFNRRDHANNKKHAIRTSIWDTF